MLTGLTHGMRFVSELQQHGDPGIQELLLPDHGDLYHRTVELAVVDFEELGIVLRCVGIEQNAGVFNFDFSNGHSAAVKRALQPVLSGVGKYALHYVRRQKYGVSAPSTAHRAGKVRARMEQGFNRSRSEKGDVYRRKEHV